MPPVGKCRLEIGSRESRAGRPPARTREVPPTQVGGRCACDCAERFPIALQGLCRCGRSQSEEFVNVRIFFCQLLRRASEQ